MEGNLLNSINKVIKQGNKCNFYSNRIPFDTIHSIADFSSIPITYKDDLRKLDPYDSLCVPIKNLYQYHESYGTTGAPLSTWFTKEDFMSYVNQLNESSLKVDCTDIILNRFPYAISVPAHIFTEYAHQNGACIIPVSKASLISPFTRVVNLITKLRPTIINGMPEELFKLNTVAEIMGINLRALNCIRALCVAGEMLNDSRKKRLENLYGAPVYNYFGCTECGNIATSNSKGYLVPSNDFYLEVVDIDTLQPITQGKGKLLVTTLKKEAFPLIRYNLGDIVELVPDPNHPYLIHHGRENDLITLNNKEYTIRDLQDIFLSFPENIIGNYFQFIVQGQTLIFQCEGDTSKNDYLNKLDLNVPFTYKIEIVEPGNIVNQKELLNVKQIGKPKYITKVTN